MRLSEGIPFKTCANPPARNQNINRANLYENEMGHIAIETVQEHLLYRGSVFFSQMSCESWLAFLILEP